MTKLPTIKDLTYELFGRSQAEALLSKEGSSFREKLQSAKMLSEYVEGEISKDKVYKFFCNNAS